MTTDSSMAISTEEFFEFVARPNMRVDPYPFYARLRSTEPLHRIPGLQLATAEPKWRTSFVIRGLEELPVATNT